MSPHPHLVIQGGSRGTNLLVSFGMKFDIIFKKMSVNVLTCQLGSLLILRCWSQGKLVMLLLMAAVFALLKCQMFFSSGGGEGFLKFTLHWIIWWWQYESKEARVPLSRIRLGWSVMTKSIHEGFLLVLVITWLWGWFGINHPSYFTKLGNHPSEARVI